MLCQELQSPQAGLKRPALEVADIFRAHQEAYSLSHVLTQEQRKVIRRIVTCRTEALGGHLDVCDHCGYTQPSYNSCRDRHCPKCQSLNQAKWIDQRLERLLPTRFFHLVFTLPAELKPLALQNRKRIFDILFETASQTILELAKDPARLGALPGITAVLHTWTRVLGFHAHLHCIVTGGGLAPSGDAWVPSKKSRYLFPVEVLSSLFRGKFLDALAKAYDQGELDLGGQCTPLADREAFLCLKDKLYRKKWVVYVKRPFGSVDHVFRYLGRYTHRVGISNQRLISLDEKGVTFFTRGDKTVTLPPQVFMNRFLLHVLPKGFVKIRHYGLLASSNVNSKLKVARAILEAQNLAARGEAHSSSGGEKQEKNWLDLFSSLTGTDLSLCPRCKQGNMISHPIEALFTPVPAPSPAPPGTDTS